MRKGRKKKVNIKLGIKYVRQMAWKSRKQQEHITYEGTQESAERPTVKYVICCREWNA